MLYVAPNLPIFTYEMPHELASNFDSDYYFQTVQTDEFWVCQLELTASVLPSLGLNKNC
jgi:hypothetical protein